MSPASANEEGGFDEERQLCSDGGCLGIVVDGTCNVCGLASVASPRESGSGHPGNASVTSPRDPGSGHPGASAGASGGDAMVAEGGHVDEAFDGEERQLCPDGACTGLVGSDGKCKECGRSAAS